MGVDKKASLHGNELVLLLESDPLESRILPSSIGICFPSIIEKGRARDVISVSGAETAALTGDYTVGKGDLWQGNGEAREEGCAGSCDRERRG